MKGISPGDKVDVLVFLRRNGDEISETGVFPILRNVRVFSINANTERATDQKGQESAFRTVSLLVKEQHVGEVVIAASVGKIHLTLRRPNEQDDQAGEEVTPMSEILAGKSRIDAPVAPPAAPDTGFGQMLQQASQGGEAAAAPAPVSEWVMHVSGPDGVRQFDWATRNGMPIESNAISTTGTASPTTTPTTTESSPTTTTSTTEPEEPATTTEPQSDGPPQVE
jgi:hypothetical protein